MVTAALILTIFNTHNFVLSFFLIGVHYFVFVTVDVTGEKPQSEIEAWVCRETGCGLVVY